MVCPQLWVEHQMSSITGIFRDVWWDIVKIETMKKGICGVYSALEILTNKIWRQKKIIAAFLSNG
jgi:hypothetical protein